MRDARVILRFRSQQLRGGSRRRARLVLIGLVLVTVVAAWLPQYVSSDRPKPYRVLVLMPTTYLAFLLITTLAAAATGGGRELIPREEATPFPIGIKTDFLLGVMLAPLNIAWLLETWLLLASVSYGLRAHWQVAAAQVVTLAWIAMATVLAQAIAAGAEYARRLRHGVIAVRGFTGLLAGAAVWLVVSHRLAPLLDRGLVTRWMVNAQARLMVGDGWRALIAVLGCLVAVAISFAAGARLAELGARHQAVEELRVESGQRTSRSHPKSDFAALLRVDRASVWRAVPLRRGIVFLGLLPGAIALAGSLHWQVIMLFPGLVASGAALLFGVNIWCLDARGAWWRESLPVGASMMFAVRTWVLAELLLCGMAPALLLGALRAGSPSPAEVAALLGAILTTVVVVSGRCLRWSIQHPYPADLRTARATPAPPLAMVGYSAKLSLLTTVLGLCFYATSLASATWALMVALVVVLFAASDLMHTARLWTSGESRAVVLTMVAG